MSSNKEMSLEELQAAVISRADEINKQLQGDGKMKENNAEHETENMPAVEPEAGQPVEAEHQPGGYELMDIDPKLISKATAVLKSQGKLEDETDHLTEEVMTALKAAAQEAGGIYNLELEQDVIDLLNMIVSSGGDK